MSVGLELRAIWVAWWYRALFARLSGQRDTIRQNLAQAFPERSAGTRRGLERRILANQGRFYGEILNFPRFAPLIGTPEIEGPGRAPFLEAVAEGRPVILVTGHIGNYVAGLLMLRRLGITAGFLYRTRGNFLLDSRFDDILAATGQKGFKIAHRSQKGYEGNLRDFMKFLAKGHVVVMLADHRDRKGMKLRFLGGRAPTSLTPAKLALAHDALLIPCFVLREGRARRFRAQMGAPIPHGKPGAMMRAFNDALSAVILEEPQQWSWTIRRW
ncbi:MAG: lysophospholipid acyltransferase family protein [Roseovarius sp.]